MVSAVLRHDDLLSARDVSRFQTNRGGVRSRTEGQTLKPNTCYHLVRRAEVEQRLGWGQESVILALCQLEKDEALRTAWPASGAQPNRGTDTDLLRLQCCSHDGRFYYWTNHFNNNNNKYFDSKVINILICLIFYHLNNKIF